MSRPEPFYKMFLRSTGRLLSASRCSCIKLSVFFVLLVLLLYGRSLPGTSACFTQRIEAGTVQITAGVWQTDESLSQVLTAELADGLLTLRVPLAESEIDTKTVQLRCGDDTVAPTEITFKDGLLTAVFEWEPVRGFFEYVTPQTVTLAVLRYSLSVPAPVSAPPEAGNPQEAGKTPPAPPAAVGDKPAETHGPVVRGEPPDADTGGDKETKAPAQPVETTTQSPGR